MDFSLGEDRQLLVDSLARYLATQVPSPTQRDTAYVSREGVRKKWRGFAELGTVGVFFGESAGGYGGSGYDIGAVFGEFGKALATGPALGTLLSGRVLELSGEHAILEGVIAGETLLAFAHDDACGADGRPLGGMHARQVNDGWLVSGTKGVVDHAHAADLLLVTTGTDQVSAFLVDAAGRGVSMRSYPTMDGGAAAEVTLTDAPARLIGRPGSAGAAVCGAIAAGLVGLSWEAVAIMDLIKDQTLEYLRTRIQFGAPIGKFQALQHRMAGMALEIEQARSAAINAAAALDESDCVRDRAGSAAKYTLGRTGVYVAEESIQMHGGIGMTWELALSHYAKRLVMIGHLLGDEDEHLQRYMRLDRESDGSPPAR
jgi:alkylation response protein AidB-like acyl-CoA dehydrogenase